MVSRWGAAYWAEEWKVEGKDNKSANSFSLCQGCIQVFTQLFSKFNSFYLHVPLSNHTFTSHYSLSEYSTKENVYTKKTKKEENMQGLEKYECILPGFSSYLRVRKWHFTGVQVKIAAPSSWVFNLKTMATHIWIWIDNFKTFVFDVWNCSSLSMISFLCCFYVILSLFHFYRCLCGDSFHIRTVWNKSPNNCFWVELNFDLVKMFFGILLAYQSACQHHLLHFLYSSLSLLISSS